MHLPTRHVSAKEAIHKGDAKLSILTFKALIFLDLRVKIQLFVSLATWFRTIFRCIAQMHSDP